MVSEQIKKLEEFYGGIPDITEIGKLITLCELTGLPHEIDELLGRPCVCFPAKENKVSDAVCHYGSYGHQWGLIEIMGLVDEEEVGDSVEGFLTAAEVFCRWYQYWKKNMQ